MQRSARQYWAAQGFFHWRLLFATLTIITALVFSTSVFAQVIAVGVSKAGLKSVTAATRTIPGVAASATFTTNGITFNIWYLDLINNTTDGFGDATDGATRQTRLTEVLTYIASVLNETGTIDIVVEESETDGSGFLASAGTLNPCADGFWGGATLFRLVNGSKWFSDTTEEIFMTVDFGWTWYEGSGTNPGDQFDLLSILLHEITHGLGLVSLTDSAGVSLFFPVGNCGGSVSTFTTWNSKVVTSGNSVLWSGNTPSLQVNVSELTSDDLFFNGTNATSLYNQGGTKPGVYAPASFVQGSSISHWDTGSIVGSAVMEHAIAPGVERRSYSPVDIGALIDIGYTSAAEPNALDQDNPYVDFGAGSNGNGAMASPFDNLADALSVANANATIHIAPGTSADTFTFTGGNEIDQDVTLVNTTGVSDVVIGSGARRGADGDSRGGFVSRAKKE